MSRSAIIAYLWNKNIGVLEHYAKRHPGVTILSPGAYIGVAEAERIKAAGGELLALEQLLSTADREKVQRDSQALADCTQEALKGEAWRQHCRENGWDGDRFSRMLEHQAQGEASNFVLLLEALARAKENYDIGLVMVIEDLMPIGRTLVNWARSGGVPSLVLSHSLILFKPYTIHDRVYGDVMALYGERGAEGYLDLGMDAQKFRVVGNPSWDVYPALKQRRASVRKTASARYGLNENMPIVVFGTTWAANFTAIGDEKNYGKTLGAFFRACGQLRDSGFPVQAVIKDRPQNSAFATTLIPRIASEHGFAAGSYAYTVEGLEELIVAADVVVSVDSNMSVEAMLVETPAINLVSEFGMHLGPCFDADTGVVESTAEELAEWLGKILADEDLRDGVRAAMRTKADYYNKGNDGLATQRVAELMDELALPGTGDAGQQQYVWQTLLQVDETDATQYHNWPRSELVDLAPRVPRRVLDIGCAGGKTGEYIKQKFPEAKVWGVEVNRAAAGLAATRLDKVFVGKFEDFDFAAHDIGPGSLDTVIVADVLEHIYDPWGVMVRLRPYLTPDAQVLASIPNTRNLVLMKELAEGDWRYEPWGLLDVTHIRFFTLKAIRRYFHETGYRVVRLHHNLDSRLVDLYQANRDKPLFTIEFDKFNMKNVTQDELGELCTIQFYVVAEPGAQGKETFDAEELARQALSNGRTAYDLWCVERALTRVQGDLYDLRMAAWPFRPQFHLAVMANQADMGRIGKSVQSLASQVYFDVSLTLVSPEPPPSVWTDSDKLVWRQVPEEKLMEAASQVLLQSGADWVGMIDAGDTVAEHSLLFLAEAIIAHPEWRFIYTDDDVLGTDGKRSSPRFKPDFNLDLLRSSPYIGGLVVISRALFIQLGGFSSTVKGAEDYDLALRAVEVAGTKAIGHVPDVLYHHLQDGGRWRLSEIELVEAGKRALEMHLTRTGVPATVDHGLFPASYRVRYIHSDRPLVSILVAVREGLDALQRCIESVLSSTRYPDYEVLIMDNDSTSPEMIAYLAGIDALGEARIRVYRHPSPASQPLLHNLLAREARGAYLLFLDFDAAVLQEDWLDCLMAHALRPEVGLVAPRSLRADGTVEQTGLVLGLDQTVDTLFHGEPMDFPGYQGRAHLEQNFSGLGGGCLLVRKSLFEQLSGFDVEHFADRFATADFSLRASAAGLLAVWTPFVSLLCEGGAARHEWRGTPVEEEAVSAALESATDHLYRRWLPQLARDPAYNPNLTLERGRYFTIETRSTLTWDPLPWRPLPCVLAHPADNMGCGEYRIISPMRALREAGKVQGWVDIHLYAGPELERINPDTIILQRQTEPKQIEAIARHKKFSKALRVFELDDLLTGTPLKSVHRTHMPKDIASSLRRALSLCDRFVVSTEPLKEAFRDYHADIRVVPNFLERSVWGGFWPLRNQSAKPRVGWAGGVGHTGDLEMITGVVRELADRVDWVFMGMCPDQMRPWVKEFHPGVPVEQYPAKLASLNLDLAIAPLEIIPFNEAKSNLRLLEYGVLGYPVVCSDIYPYRGDFPVTRVRNRDQEWVDAILHMISDRDKCADAGDRLRDYVYSHWMMEDNLDRWLQAWLP